MIYDGMKKNIDADRAQQQGYGHPLTNIMSRKVRKGKTTSGKSSLKIGQGTKFEICLKHIFIFPLMS